MPKPANDEDTIDIGTPPSASDADRALSPGLVWKDIVYEIPIKSASQVDHGDDESQRVSSTKDAETGRSSPASRPSPARRLIPGTAPKTYRTILDNLSGHVSRGEFVGILGASGAGKTTLLNVLSARLDGTGNVSGTVHWEGRPRVPKRWKRTVGYVEQDDKMFARLTVGETIRYAARLRLPGGGEQQEAVDDVVSSLRLEGCKGDRVGSDTRRGVSGGERKRTSIAVELVSEVSMMFMDEPTSGLDAFAAVSLVKTIRNIVRVRKLACLITIHQPSWAIFCQLDRVVLLAPGGVYFDGPPRDTVEWFKSIGYSVPEGANPADYFIEIAETGHDAKGRERVEKLIQAWKDRAMPAVISDSAGEESRDSVGVLEKEHEPREDGLQRRWPTNWWTEFAILYARTLHDEVRDKSLWYASVGQTIFITIIVGFAFFRLGDSGDDVIPKIGVLFIIPVNLGFAASAPVLASFAQQRGILIRERASGLYRISSFFLAKMLVELPLGVLIRLPQLFILYFMPVPYRREMDRADHNRIGLKVSAAQVFIFVAVLCLHIINSIALGLAIAGVSPTVEIANILAPLIYVVFLFFGGSFLPHPPPWFVWLKWISPIQYTYAALATNEFAGVTIDCGSGGGGSSTQCYPNGHAVLQAYGLNTFTIAENVGLLAALTAAFVVTGYLCLRITARPRLRFVE